MPQGEILILTIEATSYCVEIHLSLTFVIHVFVYRVKITVNSCIFNVWAEKVPSRCWTVNAF